MDRTEGHFLKETKMNFISLMTGLFFPLLALTANTENPSFSTATILLEKSVYIDHRRTLYCDATFMADKTVILPAGFTTEKHANRLE
jgi:deoxyribonuclease-1